MNAPLSNDLKLAPSLVDALKECAECAPHSPYIWRPKSMLKLEAFGFVAPDQLVYAGRVPYHITVKGREFLTALDVPKETP